MSGASPGLAATCGGLLLAVLGGCGKVFEYPDAEPEHGAELCSDGEDNDFDGSADCADSGCEGFCREETLAECSDGRDNDGDGLADGADARCWLLARPEVERCAEAMGVEIFETFDGDSMGFAQPSSSWQLWGSDDIAVDNSGHGGSSRRDPMLAFIGYRDGPDLDPTFNATAVVRQRPFAGSWQGFELAFSASVPARSVVRVSIAPMPLVPSLKPPFPGAERDFFAVTLDAQSSVPTFAVDVDGVSASKALTATQGICGTVLCSEYLLDVKVTWDGEGFRGTLVYPDGKLVELSAPPPPSLTLPPSRLILWGGSARFEAPAAIDDVRLRVEPEWPCGFRDPALSVESCDAAAGMTAFGHTVSVARGPGGDYCALVTASHDAGTGPEALTAWTLTDGQRWRAVTPAELVAVELPEGAEIVGAGIANDEGFHAVLAHREEGQVRLFFSEGDACNQWGQLQRGPALFPDAEAPSYVVAGGHHDIYFTRPPGEVSTQRTLWRVRRDTPESPPDELFALPDDVAAPVSIQRVGVTDLVLSYPVLPGTGKPGVGFLIGDSEGRSWERLEPGPVLELPGTLDAVPGHKLAFDDDGVASASLAWSSDGGIVLYAGRSSDGLAAASRLDPLKSELAVGVARLTTAGEVFRGEPIVARRACGDGVCGDNENDVSCATDCPPSGIELLGAALAEAEAWQLFSAEPVPALVRYMTQKPPSMNWSGGEPTWSARALEQAVTGDFELSFDLFVGFTDPTETACSLYVGLGTVPVVGAAIAGPDVPASPGIFVRADIDSDCSSRYLLRAVVVGDAVEDSRVPERASCLDGPGLRTDVWRHVVLRRRGDELSLETARDEGCGVIDTQLSEAHVRAALPEVLVGFGGASFEPCGVGEPTVHPSGVFGRPVRRGTIRNIELRSLEAEP